MFSDFGAGLEDEKVHSVISMNLYPSSKTGFLVSIDRYY